LQFFSGSYFDIVSSETLDPKTQTETQSFHTKDLALSLIPCSLMKKEKGEIYELYSPILSPDLHEREGENQSFPTNPNKRHY